MRRLAGVVQKWVDQEKTFMFAVSAPTSEKNLHG
jgi:hypothetical protein